MSFNDTKANAEAAGSRNDRVPPNETMETEQIEDEPTITLDQSTLHKLPNHIIQLIRSMAKLPSRVEMMNALVVALGLEVGFIGDWNGDIGENLNAYVLSWSYPFDRRLVKDFAKMPPLDDNESHTILKFKFSLSPQNEILVNSFDSDDLLTLVAHSIDNSVITSNRSLALPISRYVLNKKLNDKNLPGNFRNLNELSIRLKNELFLPLRNDIYARSLCKSPYPSLNGMPDDIILMLVKYLKRKDVVSLSASCKDIRQMVMPFLLRNKSKTK